MHMLHGMPLIASAFIPDYTTEPVPARNRRERRKREVVTARRRRAGKTLPLYVRKRYGYLLMLNGALYGSPRTVETLLRTLTPAPAPDGEVGG